MVNYHSFNREEEEYEKAIYKSRTNACVDDDDDDDVENEDEADADRSDVSGINNTNVDNAVPSCSKSSASVLQVRGKNITVNRRNETILKYHHKLTMSQRQALRIPKNDLFRHFYKDSVNMYKDFKTYLIKACSKSEKNANEIISSCKSVWMSFDAEMNLLPNQLANPENIEDCFVLPHIQLLKESSNSSSQKPHLQATTVQSKLNCVASLINFSKVRMVYIGITFQEMEILLLKMKDLSRFLKPYKQDLWVIIYFMFSAYLLSISFFLFSLVFYLFCFLVFILGL